MPRLSFSGFDRGAEAKARAVFESLRLTDCSLVDEALADAVLIDLDSIYGQMAWMKGLGAGKVSIGLTQAARADTAYRLEAPTAATEAVASMTIRLTEQMARTSDAFAVVMDGSPRLIVDPQRQQFAPGKSLKALLAYATAELPTEALTPLSADEAERALLTTGDPQPLQRLVWLLALGGGDGRVVGHGPGTRFQLGRWPPPEREFPKHFRIATVMLKAPGTVSEIAANSGASESEVADYVNAALATGHANPA